ncbi:chromosome segregation DNA-binding protein [Halospina denitrificans]|uniref:Probable chromosome-partitioning protein ParB n=1 Tax=Halospina denitrificans TaxID=332522 RepID=A0A4R7K390_9GAMM|nr:ParB/RepB/Spo0J family partition protein [Halospina denitrificans]TDT44059.1 chromosome segregation DNA-binding protein [Halospina denitrificans]
MASRKRGLGQRGLNALLEGSRTNLEDTPDPALDAELRELPLDLIHRGRYQPRRDMDEEALQELSDSIKQQGVMQPVVVRPLDNGEYELVAGERRWRATQMAGLERIPALIRQVPDEAAIALGLVENIQRENLNPIEEAGAFYRLQEEFGLTQQQVADAVGKSRTTITNLLRLMGLTEEVRVMLEHGDLEMGHGRALLGLPVEQQAPVARQVVSKSLSVRQTEALVRKALEAGNTGEKAQQVKREDPDIRHLQDRLADRLGARVAINHGKRGKGKVVIEYSSLDELDGILDHIK